jgi:hypothetical protein
VRETPVKWVPKRLGCFILQVYRIGTRLAWHRQYIEG